MAEGSFVSKRASLSNRLNRLKKDGLSSHVKKEETHQTKQILSNDDFLLGWQQIHKDVWKRTVLKKNILQDVYHGSLLLPEGTKAEDLIFYDTETTGLSTGAGTIPFLIGLGRIVNNDIEIIQYFLADYPGEPELLLSLKNDFPEGKLYLSYNGKSYDSHLINTRFLMNRIECKRGMEIDLLYLSRRLWKNRLDNCRLGTIEESILDIHRGPDIPGAEIPDVWFEFLKNGNLEKLKLVFSHNLQDIYSLAILLDTIENICHNAPENPIYDKYGLGKVLLFHKKEKGLDLLKEEMKSGNREAAQFLSLYYKRADNWDQAIGIWKAMNKNGFNLFAVEELAKYYEHKLKNPEKALIIVEKLLKSPMSPGGEKKDKLLHRKNRLLKKIAS